LAFPYLERSLSILNRWLVFLDSNAGENFRINFIDVVLFDLSKTEHDMAMMAINRIQYGAAKGHCERCLAYSRRFGSEGEEKITLTFDALSVSCTVQKVLCNYPEAVSFAEECYNLVVEAYDCVHPQVQEAASVLINILIVNEDFYNAESFGRVTYDNLRDKKNGIDQEGDAVATGAYNLALVILRQDGDLIKAEELARECHRIRSLMEGGKYHGIGISSLLLASILIEQKELGEETRILLEQSLAIFLRTLGPISINTSVGNTSIAQYYRKLANMQTVFEVKRKNYLLAKPYADEAYRISLQIYGPKHNDTVQAGYLCEAIDDFLVKATASFF
jgi:hypothetical protein